MRQSWNTWTAAVLAALLMAAGFSCQGAQGQTQKASESPAPPTGDGNSSTPVPANGTQNGQPAVDPEVDRVLRLAEQAGEKVQLLDAEFDYEFNQTLIEEREWRTGRLVYKKPSCIYIEFTDDPKDVYKFDGRVYVELQAKQQQRYPHILRKPSDPPVSILDVEQLPFPHPFGQKRKFLLENYDVTYKGREPLGPWQGPGSEKTTAKEKGEPCEHLVLVPKPTSRTAKEYTRVEYWLDPKTGLVRQACTEDKSERILAIRFGNIKLNEKVKAKDDLFKLGPLPSGWHDNPPVDHTEEAGGTGD